MVEKRYIVIFLLLGIMLILGGLFYVFHSSRSLTFIERGIKNTGLFIQKVVYIPVQWIDNAIDEHKEKEKMYDSYEEMKEKALTYDALEAKYMEISKELNEMEEMLELNASLSEGIYINATAINRNIDYWYQNVSLDKGDHDNVKKGDAVVNSKGLIGYIESVTNNFSTMKLLTSENLNYKISVKIEVGDSYIYGLLTYYDSSQNRFIVEGISENTGIPKDSIVTTTGLGNNFPAGLIIGKVDSVSMDHFELAKTVYVKPAANFDDINYVTIISKEGEA